MKTKYTKEEAIEAIMDYFFDNTCEFNTLIEAMNEYDDTIIGDKLWRAMDEIEDEFCSVRDAIEAALDNYRFDINDEYFRNDYHLESTSDIDYSDDELLDENFVERLFDMRELVSRDIPSEVASIMDNISEDITEEEAEEQIDNILGQSEDNTVKFFSSRIAKSILEAYKHYEGNIEQWAPHVNADIMEVLSHVKLSDAVEASEEALEDNSSPDSSKAVLEASERVSEEVGKLLFVEEV